MSKLYLGIDPGANGGIVWLNEHCEILSCIKMPATPKDLLSVLGEWVSDDVICLLEKVGGISGQSASASFTFGRGYGELIMALIARNIPFMYITPQKWQKHFYLSGKRGESKTAHKNRIKGWAQQRFPQQKVTLWAADALAIAVYCYENYREK